jgi:hypothetical protein
VLRREFEISSDPDGYQRLECRINNAGQAEIVVIYGPEERVVYLDADEVSGLRAALNAIDDSKTWEAE